MPYGDLLQVKRMIRSNPSMHFGSDEDARLEAIQAAVTATLEERMGRTFGATAEDTTHLFYVGGSPVLLLPLPARAITSVTLGGTVSGGTVTGGQLIGESEYAHDPVNHETGLIYGLRLLSGANWGAFDVYRRPLIPVEVVGDFIDSDDDSEVPADVTYIANYLIAERFKLESASPAGFIGPDGLTTPVRDAWNDTMVKTVIGRYRRAGYRQAVL